MNKELAEKITELLKNPEISEKVAKCSELDEVYDVCSAYLPDVSKEQFTEVVRIVESKETELPDEDLEEVAGGIVHSKIEVVF